MCLIRYCAALHSVGTNFYVPEKATQMAMRKNTFQYEAAITVEKTPNKKRAGNFATHNNCYTVVDIYDNFTVRSVGFKGVILLLVGRKLNMEY